MKKMYLAGIPVMIALLIILTVIYFNFFQTDDLNNTSIIEGIVAEIYPDSILISESKTKDPYVLIINNKTTFADDVPHNFAINNYIVAKVGPVRESYPMQTVVAEFLENSPGKP